MEDWKDVLADDMNEDQLREAVKALRIQVARYARANVQHDDVDLAHTETFMEYDITYEGKKVGTVELCPERHEISRLVIFEPYQNNGYGTKTVRQLVERGYTSLWVRSDNPRAIHVYEKCGFRRGETHMFEMRYEKEGAKKCR